MSVRELRESLIDGLKDKDEKPRATFGLKRLLPGKRGGGGLADNLQAPKSGFAVYRATLHYVLAQHRGLMLQLLCGAILSNAFMLALPLFTMALYDRVIPHQALETLWALALGVAIALILDLALRSTRLKLSEAIGLNAGLQLQAHIYRHLMQIKMAGAPRTAGGVSQYMRELDSFCQLLPQLVASVVVDLPFFGVILVLLYSIGGPIILAPIVGTLMLCGIHALSYANARRSYYESMQFAKKQANMITESVQALEAIKSAAAEEKLIDQWEQHSDASSYIGHKSRFWAGFAAQASSTITQFTIVFVAIIGVYEVTNGHMTAGALSAAILLIGRALAPVSQTITLFGKLHHLNHVADGLVTFLAVPRESAGSDAAHASRVIRGKINLHNLSFTYPGAPAPCLQRVTLKIEAGERIGIIGRVGSGKSTLLRMITRLYEANEGSLLIDGYDVQQYDPATLRRDIGFMRQDASLFDGTLEENIVFGSRDFPAAAFEEAASISGVKEFASRHPQGYSLQVGVSGENLSGGERQSVALARILLQNPRVLLFDEPSAGLDSAHEARLVSELRKYITGKTLLLATHRATLLALVDRIILLEAGRVIADGPRDEILKKLSPATAAKIA